MSVSVEDVLALLDPKLRKRLGTGEGINFEYQPISMLMTVWSPPITPPTWEIQSKRV